jgi:hypothetical protein
MFAFAVDQGLDIEVAHGIWFLLAPILPDAPGVGKVPVAQPFQSHNGQYAASSAELVLHCQTLRRSLG